MKTQGISALVTGGASGLGLATARRLRAEGAEVVIVDLPSSQGADIAREIGAHFAPADVTHEAQVAAACDLAQGLAPLRVLVHCAGRGGPVRLIDKEGNPGSLETYENIVRINLVGTFNTLRLAAVRMARNEPTPDGERGVCVLTASVAAYEGQIGQIGYASSKAGVVGLTLPVARELARFGIRVMTIAPGVFWTPMVDGMPQAVQDSLAATIPFPSRLGRPEEFADTVAFILRTRYLNGETIRLDGAIRLAPK